LQDLADPWRTHLLKPAYPDCTPLIKEHGLKHIWERRASSIATQPSISTLRRDRVEIGGNGTEHSLNFFSL
jgi:hypothetical protein